MKVRSKPMAICLRVAASQYGLVTRQQALEAGLSPDTIQRLLSQGSWVPVQPGVYRIWLLSNGAARWRQELMGGSLWLGGVGAVSHRAGALLWDTGGIERAPLEFSTTGRKRPERASALVIHHVQVLEPRDLTLRKGFTVTKPARTLVDLPSVVSAEVVELVFESMMRRELATLNEIRAAADRAGRRRRGRRALDRVLYQYIGTPTGSTLEALAWQVFKSLGLPLPVRQYEVRDARGVFIARPDFAYPELLIAIELDGFESHSRRHDFIWDRRRQNALTRRGWTVYRLTREDLARPKSLKREIEKLRRLRSTSLSLHSHNL